MAKTITFIELRSSGSNIDVHCTSVLNTGETIDSLLSIPIPFPSTLTVTQANNFIKNVIVTDVSDRFGITLALSDILIIGGAV